MTSPTAEKAAKSPQEMHGVFKEFLEAGDLDGLMSLYEEGASMVTANGPVTGLAAVREQLAPLTGMQARITFEPALVAQSGDLALVHAKWEGIGTSPEGPVSFSGITSEVVRRQADGTWKYVIDDPGIGVSQG